METPTDSATGAIVKSDRTGRTRYSRQYKQEVVDAFHSSAMSAPAFASHCGIKYPTFASWLAKRSREERGSARDASPAFLIADLPLPGHPGGLEVRLPGGATARASDAEQIRLLADLLRQLA